MFLDLDRFKVLNDTHGHEAGDLLLLEVADRLKKCIREVDAVSRFGGDEFVVMLSELYTDKDKSKSLAHLIADRIRVSLAMPFNLVLRKEGHTDYIVEHQCSASIGVVMFMGHEAGQDDVLKWADTAMYQAKEAGRNAVKFYDPARQL